MNLRSVVMLEIIKDTKLFRLELPIGALYSESHEAVLEFGQMVLQMAKQSEEQAKKQQEKPIEPEVVEKI